MIIKEINVEKFRAMNNQSFKIGKRLTAIAGRNGTMKSTLLGMLGQPFSIASSSNPMYGSKTIEGYNFKSQFQEKFCLSDKYDCAGNHVWTLKLFNSNLYNGIDEYTVKSAARKQTGHPDSIRFINALGKARGMGYIQLPVVFLSLSRLFPIGESGKTKSLASEFTESETELYIKWYKEILSIQSLDKPIVGLEKKDLKRIFTGVGDSTHDVTTCSAGEGNVGRVLTSILSFKRLKDKFGKNYKGGILLIDELDATLYGYSQKKFVQFLNRASQELGIQIIFTTHSPIILREMSNLQRKELRKLQIDVNSIPYQYDNEIIYLYPKYTDEGSRYVEGKNIHTVVQLNEIINDINLLPTSINQNINLYMEDERAVEFIHSILKYKAINLDQYVNIYNIDLGWPNYLQLHRKGIPEFRNSLIILDHDVMACLSKEQREYIDSTNNITFMPEDVEAGMFRFLKSHEVYNRFEEILSSEGYKCSYDVCFCDWTDDHYDTLQTKKWFSNLIETIGGTETLYKFWANNNVELVNQFVQSFIDIYNNMAEKLEMDYIIKP